jgi:hypothetical protein
VGLGDLSGSDVDFGARNFFVQKAYNLRRLNVALKRCYNDPVRDTGEIDRHFVENGEQWVVIKHDDGSESTLSAECLAPGTKMRRGLKVEILLDTDPDGGWVIRRINA